MFPGVSPQDMHKVMKRLGIKQNEIDAELVIIKTKDSNVIIRNPQVSKINMMGQETFQVIGDIEEVKKNRRLEITEEDIETVMQQTKCSRVEAVNALEESNGNLAEAIISLQNK